MLPVRTGTLVMLIVALLFGGLAVFIAKAWLANQQAQVSQQVTPEPVNVETQKIVVAEDGTEVRPANHAGSRQRN